jgi:uncharacterized protein YllA (UPF0747 family)
MDFFYLVKAMQDYSEKLKDPRWQKKRLEILERDNWTCRSCGDKKTTLHVHHVIYLKGLSPWDYNKDCLLTLCESCHNFEHAYGDMAKSALITSLSNKGFLAFDIINIAKALHDLEPHAIKQKLGLCDVK